jgi:heme exporter protein A
VPANVTALAVQVSDVSKRYGRRWALAHLQLELEPGGSLLLTGHNGSGKTTLLKLLATAAFPTSGQIRVLDLDARREREAIRQKVALLSHSHFLYEELSAEQNVLLLARLIGADNPRQATRDVLGRVGLLERANQSVRQFSAGMRKRLAIARLLVKKPALALLDEPFGELDPEGIHQMEQTIRELTEAGTTVVLATHLVEQGQALCRQRLHLVEGRAVAP